jgi:HlyD family secretion protein
LRIFEKSERFLEVGTPLLEIGDPSNIEVVVDVLSSDAVRIRPGLKMLIDNPDSAEPLRAQVKVVEPQAVTKVSALGVEEKRVDVIADFIDSKPSFGDNFRVDTHVVVWQGSDVLSIPNSALFRSGDDWMVFVVEGGHAYLRKVATGHRSRTDTEISEGINEGDAVIVHPPNGLADGARVTDE